jgi:N-formylglutamate deformylase
MDFRFRAGSAPLLISMPHVGTDIPDHIAATVAPIALARADTDWHLELLYAFAEEMGASTLAARWSRYVIDVNRPPEDTNLYPGLDTTGLCPVDTFARAPLYQAGRAPSDDDVKQRLQRYWQPYHQQLRAELDRLRRLPDLNFGTAGGASCAPELAHAVLAVAQEQQQFSVAVNGRFKGGFITRHYGQPHHHVHAIQLEMCQCLYMDEAAPFGYRADHAAQVLPVLRDCVGAALDWVRQ